METVSFVTKTAKLIFFCERMVIMNSKINVLIWNEYLHELKNETVGKIYPNGIHTAIGDRLKQNERLSIKTATLAEPEHGLTDEVLAWADVLIWWGHKAHELVDDTVVNKVYERVQAGMGFIALHSAHASKIFSKLMGTNSALLKWREDDLHSTVWTIMHNHPIAKGIPDSFLIPQEETYGERFEIPRPDDIIFISSYAGGEVFRSGVTFTRGLGRIFYFQPGHETYPVYYQSEVQQVIENAVFWAAPDDFTKPINGNFPGRV